MQLRKFFIKQNNGKQISFKKNQQYTKIWITNIKAIKTMN